MIFNPFNKKFNFYQTQDFNSIDGGNPFQKKRDYNKRLNENKIIFMFFISNLKHSLYE